MQHCSASAMRDTHQAIQLFCQLLTAKENSGQNSNEYSVLAKGAHYRNTKGGWFCGMDHSGVGFFLHRSKRVLVPAVRIP
jgi:hypothetical protein